jgi:hypothetical protein
MHNAIQETIATPQKPKLIFLSSKPIDQTWNSNAERDNEYVLDVNLKFKKLELLCTFKPSLELNKTGSTYLFDN